MLLASISTRWNELHFLTLVTRQIAALSCATHNTHVISIKLSGAWRKQCLNTSFTLRALLYVGYSTKLKIFTTINEIVGNIIFNYYITMFWIDYGRIHTMPVTFRSNLLKYCYMRNNLSIHTIVPVKLRYNHANFYYISHTEI